MNPSSLIYVNFGLTIVLLCLLVWQIYKLNKLNRIRKEFFKSDITINLEEVLVDQNRQLKQIDRNLRSQDQSLAKIFNSNLNNFQKMGFVRFNPFDDSGGNISFALALMNDHKDGLVISSLHGRDGTRVYAKMIKHGKSEIKLTTEEQEAIANAN